MDDIQELLRDEISRQIFGLNKVEPGSEEESRIIKNVGELSDKLNKFNATDIEAEDKYERREIEKAKNDRLASLEEQKSKLDVKRAGFEMLKLIIPGMIGGAFYLEAQKRILKFEEFGRLTTSAGKDLHLPNLFTFWKK